MTKKETTEARMKNLETELAKLKSRLFDIDAETDRKLNEVVSKLNQVSIVVDYHAHPMMSGRAIFLEAEYRASVEAAQQQQPAPPVKEEIEEE